MKKLKNLIIELDNYGEAPLLIVDGKETTKSFLGGLLTIIKFSLFIFLMVYYFIKFVTSREIKTINEKRSRINDEILNVPVMFMNFSIFIVDWSGENVRGLPLVNISHSLEYVTRFLNPPKIINKPLLLDRCSNPKSYSNKLSSRFKFLNLNDCVSYNYNQSELELGISSSYRKVLKYISKIDLCPAFEMNHTKCKNLDYLSKVSGSRTNNYSLLIFNDEAQPTMSEPEGYKTKLNGIRNFIDLSLDYHFTLKIMKNILYTDHNLIFDFMENSESSFYTIESSIISSSRSPQDANLFSMSILVEASDVDILHYRNYEKLDEVFSKIFSLFEISNLLLQLLNLIVGSGRINSVLIKKLFSVYVSDNNINRQINISKNYQKDLIIKDNSKCSKDLDIINNRKVVYSLQNKNNFVIDNENIINEVDSHLSNKFSKRSNTNNYSVLNISNNIDSKRLKKQMYKYKFQKCLCLYNTFSILFKQNKNFIINSFLNKLVSFEIDIISILKRIKFLEITISNNKENFIKLNNNDIEDYKHNEYSNCISKATKDIIIPNDINDKNYEFKAEKYKYY